MTLLPKGHGRKLKGYTKQGEGAEFIIELSLNQTAFFMKRYIILFVLSCCATFGFAQQFLYIGSLRKVISTENKEDTSRVKRLLYLSNGNVYNKPLSGMYYANSELRVSQKLGYTSGEASAYMAKNPNHKFFR